VTAGNTFRLCYIYPDLPLADITDATSSFVRDGIEPASSSTDPSVLSVRRALLNLREGLLFTSPPTEKYQARTEIFYL